MSAKDTATAADPHRSTLPPPPPARFDPNLFVPDDAQCFRYWEEFAMLDNVAEHSRMVAVVATFLAKRAVDKGLDVDVPTVRASALLHDLAKTYCIEHGGNHSQIGAAWAMQLTNNPCIAHGVMHHVYWPFDLDIPNHFLPFCVLYADKRVSHDTIVDMEARFVDLVERYGHTDAIKASIKVTHDQAVEIERLMSELIGEDLKCESF